MIDDEVDRVLKQIGIELFKRYEFRFLEIGTEQDHVRFLIQSVPTYSPMRIVTKVKSITAREMFSKVPTVKKRLWGREFWTDCYFVSTVSEHAPEDVIREYIKNQGKQSNYKKLYKQAVSYEPLAWFRR